MAGTGILPAVALGLQGVSLVAQGMGAAAGNRSEADKAERTARIGRVQADQIDATLRGELSDTISNIRAISAAAGAPVDSPALEAFMEGEIRASDRDRITAVSSARLQAGQSSLDAMAYRRAARWSLIGGAIGGLTKFAGIPEQLGT